MPTYLHQSRPQPRRHGRLPSSRRRVAFSRKPTIGAISPDPDGAGSRPRLATRRTFAANGDLTKMEIGTVTGTSQTDLNAMTVAQASEMSYDADGVKLTDKLTGGGSTHALTQYSYDSEHRLQCAAVRMNSAVWGSLPSSACTLGTQGSFGPDRITKTLRDANGRPTEIKAAFGVTGEEASERILAYSANGVLSHLIDANTNRTTYEYDGHDRLVKTRFPITTIGSNSSSTTDYEQLTLDANGNVTNRRLRDAQNIGYTYDALNRLTAKNLPGSEPDATYSYDLLNRMTSAMQNSLTSSMTWDALGRMLTEATTGLGTVTSEYDLAGRRTKVTLPGSTSLYADYLYDLLGNVTFIRENGATSGVGVLATYQYDSLSRRSSVTFGNGVVQGYTYDNAARLATQTNDLASTANDLTQTFSYNPASQISSVTRSNDLYAWTGHTNVNLSSTPNGLNQIGNVGASSVTHDSKGNITAVGSSSYGYSSENFLTSGPSSTTISYDPMGRLYQVASGGTTTRMGYDGTDRIAEYNGSNTLQRRYIHGPGVDNPLVAYEGTGTTSRSFLSADERGSIISLTDSSGTLSNINKYDEYGVPQSTNLGKFGYTGQAWVPEVGLWYYKARFYRPDIGRFMQTDPIGYESGLNLYAYVLNDPVNLIDPLGLFTTIPCDPAAENCVTGKRRGGSIGNGLGPGNGPPDLFFNLPHFEDIGGVDRTTDKQEEPPEEITVTGERKKRLSVCIVGFLNSRGLVAPNLRDVTFVRGMERNAATRRASKRGATAITLGNEIFVRPSQWNTVTSPYASATFFEEVVHTVQFARSGTASFLLMYGLGAAMSELAGSDGGYPNHIEIEAKGLAERLWQEYRSLPLGQRC